jgi:hypothetical protein
MAASASANEFTYSCGLLQPGGTCLYTGGGNGGVHSYIFNECQYAGSELEPCSAFVWNSSFSTFWEAGGAANSSAEPDPILVFYTPQSGYAEVTNNSCCAHTITGFADY